MNKKNNKKNQLVIYTKEKKDILKQHSALTSFSGDKYITNYAERSILYFLKVAQDDMTPIFLHFLEDFFDKLLKTSEAKEYIRNKIITIEHEKKEIPIKPEDINLDALIDIGNEYYEFINKKLKSSNLSEEDKKEIIKTKEESNLLDHMIKHTQNKLFITTKDDILNLILDIKGFAKLKTVEEYKGEKQINLTKVANALDLQNLNKLKKDLLNVPSTTLYFNLINRKNIPIETSSAFLSSISFTKAKKSTWLTYEIPESILKLILSPMYYAEIPLAYAHNLRGKYSIRLYSLLADNMYRGRVEVTRNELKKFLNLTPSVLTHKAALISRVLEPTFSEIETIAGLEVKYKLVPDSRNFEEIHIRMSAVKKPIIIEANVKNGENELSPEIETLLYEKTLQLKQIPVIKQNWNKWVDNKIVKTCIENGKEFTIDLLNTVVLFDVNKFKTLTKFMNETIKSMKKQDKYKIKSRKKAIMKVMESRKENRLKPINSVEISVINLLQKCISEKRQVINLKYLVTEDELNDEYLRRIAEIQNAGKKVTDDTKMYIYQDLMNTFITK